MAKLRSLGFDSFPRSRSSIMVPEGRSGQIFEIFEFLGGAGDINNSMSMLNYCNGPYIRLLPCANKEFSAWTEVWGTPCCSKAPIVAPEGRFGQILRFLRFWAGLMTHITR